MTFLGFSIRPIVQSTGDRRAQTRRSDWLVLGVEKLPVQRECEYHGGSCDVTVINSLQGDKGKMRNAARL